MCISHYYFSQIYGFPVKIECIQKILSVFVSEIVDKFEQEIKSHSPTNNNNIVRGTYEKISDNSRTFEFVLHL